MEPSSQPASSNLLALGHHQDSTLTEKVIIQRWNGKAWSTQPSPSLGGATAGGYLTSAQAFSPTSAWVVGHYFNSSTIQTLILYWNGTEWSVVPSPNPGGSSANNILMAVAAASSTDAWAVGFYDFQTMILHWNGTGWAQVASP